jgi:hypothetical protein
VTFCVEEGKAAAHLKSRCHPRCREEEVCASSVCVIWDAYWTGRDSRPLDHSACKLKVFLNQCRKCCRTGLFIPDPNFLHPGSEFFPSRIQEF